MTDRHDTRVSLNVYLLDAVDFSSWLALQLRLVFEVSGDRSQGALVLCEHPPLISVGRHGSREQVHFDHRELSLRGWPIRWVNRGGGALLHLRGQLAIYPIFPLDRLGLDLRAYLHDLQTTLRETAADFGAHATLDGKRPGVQSSGRLLAHVGVAVRDWVSYFGAAFNINPGLEHFRRVDCDGFGQMTSLERERRLAVNPDLVRHRLIERFCEQFGLPTPEIFHSHPALSDGTEYRPPAKTPAWHELLMARRVDDK